MNIRFNPSLAQMEAPPPEAHPESARHPAHHFAARLATILIPLLRLINAGAPVLGAFFLPLHARLVRAHQRFARLLARLAAGKPPRLRAAPPATTDTTSRNGGPPAAYLPRRRAWIVVKLGHHAAAYAAQLQFLLNDPATQALLAAAPPEFHRAAGRTLRPLCRLLGADLPAILQRPAPPPRPKPVKTRRQPPSTPRRLRTLFTPTSPLAKKPA